MNNNTLIIKNNLIKIKENNANKHTLKIKKAKVILSEDVTQSISTDQAFSTIKDTFVSTSKIGEAIIKNFLSNIKFLISVSLLPISQNLDNIIKSYETEISNSNKLLLDSIPSNVLNSTNILTIASNPSSLIFEKMMQNFENIQGIKDIINIKNLSNIIIPDPVKKIISNSVNSGKNITSSIFSTVLTDLPKYLQGEYSTYRNTENAELQELRKRLSGRSNAASISGLPISITNHGQNTLLEIINDIRNGYTTRILNSINDSEVEFLHNLYNILYLSKHSQNWEHSQAISPNNTDLKTRHQLVYYPNYFITLTRPNTNIQNNGDWNNCFIALDNGTNQVTSNISLASVF